MGHRSAAEEALGGHLAELPLIILDEECHRDHFAWDSPSTVPILAEGDVDDLELKSRLLIILIDHVGDEYIVSTEN
ncbi:MAG: hypothetical protein WC813_00980 [Patescibacteria group bacterium]|jgi:hypothetical protein